MVSKYRFAIESRDFHLINRGQSTETFIYAAKMGHLPAVKYLIEELNVHPNPRAIKYAAALNQVLVVKYLYPKTECAFISVLSHAAMNGHLELMIYLLSQKSELDIFEEDKAFDTACQYGQLHVVKYLLEDGVSDVGIGIGMRLAVIYQKVAVAKYIHERYKLDDGTLIYCKNYCQRNQLFNDDYNQMLKFLE